MTFSPKEKNTDPHQSAFVLAPASFLTFGKVNDSPLPTPPPHFCQRRASPLRLTFFWGGGGVQITNRPKPDSVHSVHVIQKCEQDLPISELGLHRHQCVMDRQIEQQGHQWMPLFTALSLVNLVRDTNGILPPVTRWVRARGPDATTLSILERCTLWSSWHCARHGRWPRSRPLKDGGIGYELLWLDPLWPRPCLATTLFGHDLVRPGRLWPQAFPILVTSLNWPIGAVFGQVEPICANFSHPPCLGRFLVARPIDGPSPSSLPGPPKISRFFSFSHLHFHSFFSLWGKLSCLVSLWRSSRGILVLFWSVGTSDVLVFALGLTCHAAACRRGFTGQPKGE